MTDYNDGKWHGWNGGECPVDPKATVQAAYADEGGPLEMEAGEFIWSGSETAIVAFRVIKPAPPKPRECWSYGEHIRYTEADAMAFRQAVADRCPGMGYEAERITKWIEVLP